jgi:predicted nucleotidyltransferase
MGVDALLLSNPNDILAVEYCKAILAQGSPMRPFPIRRDGNYHDTAADAENPSATSIRNLITDRQPWEAYVPAEAVLTDAPVHTLAAGERAVLARLRTMSDADFEALPYGSEGLWRKLMHASRENATLEDILTATKSKRYARSRLDRMVMCAFLGLTQTDLETPPPYVRVLGFGQNGIGALKTARETGFFPHIGEKTALAYEALEQRLDDLYGLFCESAPTPAGQTEKRRIYLSK